MTTNRNQPVPSGKWTLTPANIEAVREYAPRNREWPEQMNVFVVGGHLGESRERFQSQRRSQLAVGARGNCGSQMGIERLESKRKRLSVCKGTREAQSRKCLLCQREIANVQKTDTATNGAQCWQTSLAGVIARITSKHAGQSSPMRRLSGGVSVVVRGRESRLHGEGRQDDSCWMTEGFTNREGSR